MITLTDIRTRCQTILQEQGHAGDLGPANITEAIRMAVQSEYSHDKPRRITVDITGDGTFSYPVEDHLTEYVDGFSQIVDPGIEYPVDDTVAEKQYLLGEDWLIYRTPSGLELILRSCTPSATESMRLTYTAKWAFSSDDDNAEIAAPVTDRDAIAFLSASHAFRLQAARAADETDSSIEADTYDRNRKYRYYMELSAAYAKLYAEAVGKRDGPLAADGIGDWDQTLQNGEPYLTHPSRYR